MRRLAWGALIVVMSCTAPELQLPRPGASSVTSAVGSAPPSATRARAFVIERREDLLSGSQADGQLGDLRLDNGRVAFIIDAVGTSLGFADSGGQLIDAAPMGGADSLQQILGYLDDTFPRQPIYERAEPGRRGELALVRAVGHDSMDPTLKIETEYSLAPGSLALEITTTVTNGGSETRSAYDVGDAVQWGRTERFLPGSGFAGSGRLAIAEGWAAGLGDGVTYLYAVDKQALRGIHGSTWSDFNIATMDLPPGGTLTATRWLIVGDGAGALAADALAALRKEPRARLEGRVVEEGTGAPLPGARVVLDGEGGRPVAVARATAAGYTLVAAPGPYTVRAQGLGRRGVDLDVQLGLGRSTFDVIMSKPGHFAFTVVERVGDKDQPIPAKLTFAPADGAPLRLGPSFADPSGNVALTVDGAGELALPPGHYRVTASRGPEYTIDEQELDVPPGESTHAAFSLTRAVDLGGWLCADLHQHAAPSADSAVSLRDRAASNLAEGLETMVATDHNIIADWPPVLAKLGATRPLALVVGDEATRDGIGHFNAYPLAYHGDRPRGGAFDVRGKSAHEIVAGLRAPASADDNADRVVQVNHPRAGAIGYFENLKLDPKGNALPADWEGGFDAIEIFSSKDVSQAEAPLRDWFWLLDRGLAYTGVGGSDSHVIHDVEVGYPRTCVPGNRFPSQPAAALVDGIKRRREALVTNGPFVRVAVAGKGMGQLAPAPRGRARLDVEVQAAPWVDVRHLEVYVNGERRGKPIELAASKARVRYKDSIDLRIERDAYVVLIVRGDASLEPVVAHLAGRPPTTPLAITNPIFLDRDGDGKYLAPRDPRPVRTLSK